MINIEDITEKQIHFIAAMAQDFGFLDEVGYRNLCIKLAFNELRKNKVTVEKAEIILSKKWTSRRYKLTPKSIHGIVYKK